MKFNAAVIGTPELAAHLQTRLNAISKAHQNSIIVKNLKKITGSVNIDLALQSANPHDNRWDYAIGYHINSQEDKAFFVEFHKAIIDEVNIVISKKQWLVNWMSGKQIDNLLQKVFVWVSSGGINIPDNSPHRRIINLNGILLRRRVNLDID
jgi:hypothetical protein